MTVTLTIDMDKKCAECGEGGATGSGLCLPCCTKAIDPRRPMKSIQGQLLRERLKRQFAASQRSSQEGK